MTKEESQELATAPEAEKQSTHLSLKHMQVYSQIFKKSGYFKGVVDEWQGIVKIMAGQELGLTPFTSMKGINIIDGKPELSAGLMGTLIKRSGKYDYRVSDWSTKGCTITILQDGKEVGSATFDEDDAQAAKLLNKDNWRNHPKAMYFARALAYAARTYCPDVLGGGSVYVEGEISGDSVEAEVVETKTETKSETKIEPTPDPVIEEAEVDDNIDIEGEPEFPEDEPSIEEVTGRVAEKMEYLAMGKSDMMRLNRIVFGTPASPSPMTVQHWLALESELDEMIAKKEETVSNDEPTD